MAKQKEFKSKVKEDIEKMVEEVAKPVEVKDEKPKKEKVFVGYHPITEEEVYI